MTVNDQKCGNCGHTVDDGAAFCPQCGRQVLAGMGPSVRDGDTYLALVTANVLRLRRQWELAEAMCSEVLQRDPQSAAACSVMGDIARDQGKMRDAIEWYKMALDRNPGGAAERKKLEALIDQVFAPGREGAVQKAAAAVSRGVSDAIADVRTARPPGWLALIVGTVLLIIFLIALSTVLMGRRVAALPQETGQVTPAPSSTSVIPASVPVPEKMVKRPDESPKMAKAPPDLLAREPELLQRLRKDARQMDPNCEVREVEIDPQDATVDVHVAVPRLWTVGAMREAISRDISAVAGSVAEWDDRIPGVRQRYTLRGPGGAEQVAAVAKGTKEQVARLRGGDGRDIEKAIFVWWSPELKE